MRGLPELARDAPERSHSWNGLGRESSPRTGDPHSVRNFKRPQPQRVKPSCAAAVRSLDASSAAGWSQYCSRAYDGHGDDSCFSFACSAEPASDRRRSGSGQDMDRGQESISRTLQRGVKYYESMRLVNEIESRLKEWNDEARRGQCLPPRTRSRRQQMRDSK